MTCLFIYFPARSGLTPGGWVVRKDGSKRNGYRFGSVLTTVSSFFDPSLSLAQFLLLVHFWHTTNTKNTECVLVPRAEEMIPEGVKPADRVYPWANRRRRCV